jgi:hypothetical protein
VGRSTEDGEIEGECGEGMREEEARKLYSFAPMISAILTL